MNANCVVPLALQQCSGCGACAMQCPFGALKMDFNAEGFRVPTCDAKLCTHCGKCVRVCPLRTPIEKNAVRAVYACQHRDEKTLFSSASGGAFSALAACVFKRGGVVFGARYDENLNVYHDYAETPEALDVLRGSKYTESDLRGAYEQVKTFLEAGRVVLFTGTPCQVAGLYRALGKDYANLWTADLICHGVPSKHFLAWYLQQQKKKYQTRVTALNMRDKARAKERRDALDFNRNCAMRLTLSDGRDVLLENGQTNDYTRLFIQAKLYRDSCYHCPFADTTRIGDWTLGDFWGYKVQGKTLMTISYGISALLINTPRAQELTPEIEQSLILETRTLPEVSAENVRLTTDTHYPRRARLAYTLMTHFPNVFAWKVYFVQWLCRLRYWIRNKIRRIITRR